MKALNPKNKATFPQYFRSTKENSMKFLLPFLMLLIGTASCKKHVDCDVSATVFDGGTPAADGCGWLLKIGDTYYHPHNLPDSFKQSGRAVTICYRKTGDHYTCGLGASQLDEIHLTDIK